VSFFTQVAASRIHSGAHMRVSAAEKCCAVSAASLIVDTVAVYLFSKLYLYDHDATYTHSTCTAVSMVV
jgi:hypothetical protein